MADEKTDVHEKLMGLLKRRGYLQPSYEIYGGVAGFYDYGPLGAALKTNIENQWRRFYVLQEGMAEIQCPTISPAEVFRASGHLEKFADTVIDCPACGAGNRGDHLVRNEWKRLVEEAEKAAQKAKAADLLVGLSAKVDEVRANADKDPSPANLRALLDGSHTLTRGTFFTHTAGDATVAATAGGLTLTKGGKDLYKGVIHCPSCNKPLDVQKARIEAFNLMFKTNVGPGAGRVGYLRPETAQGMFMDFDWLYRYFREQLPFGAVQIGKAYRNEISPRQGLLRLREFHQMEAEVFFDPADKTWSRFERLADRELNLLPHTAQTGGDEVTVKMRMADAVEKGVIANGALGYFIALTDEFLESVGLKGEHVRFRQHLLTEKAHYSTDTWDAEFLSPRFGWVEIVGIADRTDYDLKAHMRVSGKELTANRQLPTPREVTGKMFEPNAAKLGPAFRQKAKAVSEALQALNPDTVDHAEGVTVTVDGESVRVGPEFYTVKPFAKTVTTESFVPHVVEPSYGIDRIFYAVLEMSYMEKEWATLALRPQVAPVKVGVFPLMAKDGLDQAARDIDRVFRESGVASLYDDSGSIGKRYARADEIGVPFCVTVDYDTLEKGTVTIRDRDTAAQVTVKVDQLWRVVLDLLSGRVTVGSLGA
ncbi:MAG TPA: glycine--tRNA ligase [Candidatus Thermoplasmatota archaeon]|nr:glycine--tRNA ligase [Candidatus Thermoplasmatota archaeon]